MATLRHRMIGAGLAALRATGLHRGVAPWTRGRGAILAFHHVRPWVPRAFAPNRLLEITPDHLDAVLRHVAREGYEVVPLADVVGRLAGAPSGRFVALTFDDGYRDNLVHALPVLERHHAPFTVFVTPGFVDGTARLWWLELERAVAQAENMTVPFDGGVATFATRTTAEKERVFDRLARRFRSLPNAAVDRALDAMGVPRGAARALTDELCLSWAELVRMAGHPLATLGGHTLTHPNLARLDAADLRRELDGSRAAIEYRVGRPVSLLAYPYGSAAAAGPREFAAAVRAGFAAAVTTRPGVLRARHAAHPTALPRISVNGLWPDLAALDILLSGAPLALGEAVRRILPG